jgi:hypothetical protein
MEVPVAKDQGIQIDDKSLDGSVVEREKMKVLAGEISDRLNFDRLVNYLIEKRYN